MMKLFYTVITIVVCGSITAQQTQPTSTTTTDSAYYPTQIILLKADADSFALVPLPAQQTEKIPTNAITDQGFNLTNMFAIYANKKTWIVLPSKILTSDLLKFRFYKTMHPIYSDAGGFVLIPSPSSEFEDAAYVYDNQPSDLPEQVRCSIIGYGGESKLKITQVSGTAVKTPAQTQYLMCIDSTHRASLTNLAGSLVVVNKKTWGVVTKIFFPAQTDKLFLFIEPLAGTVKNLLAQSQRE